MDEYGNVKSVKAVYVPTEVDLGRYDVKLTRVDTDFYHVYGTNVYIATRYCYEYARQDEAILNVKSNLHTKVFKKINKQTFSLPFFCHIMDLLYFCC